MNLRSAMAHKDVRLGAVRDVFANTDADFMYYVFQRSARYDSVAEWLRDLALDEYYKKEKTDVDHK